MLILCFCVYIDYINMINVTVYIIMYICIIIQTKGQEGVGSWESHYCSDVNRRKKG